MASEILTAPQFADASGSYSLIEELAFGPSAANNAQASTNNSQPSVVPSPPPPARLVTVTAQFPPKVSRSREPSAQDAPLLADENEQSWTKDGTISSAATKRRALVSLPSLPAIPAVGSDPKPGPSKPRTALKGTTSNHIKGYDGLPLSGSTLRNLGPALGGTVDWAFWTCGKCVFWADLHPTKIKEPLAKLTFSTAPTALAVANDATPERIELLIGFVTGDLMLLDPLCARYTRYNKAGAISSSPVTCLQWIPQETGHSTFFASGHADGAVLVWDREREDGSWTASMPPPKRFRQRVPASGQSAPSEETFIEAAEDIVVTSPSQPPSERRSKAAPAFNPIGHWWISRRGLTDLAFSPDGQRCALTSADGVLRIIDVTAERLLDAFGSYFGGYTSVGWSRDGRFIAVGGEDDLVSIYAPLEQHMIARCQGHTSFVSGVAFDEQSVDDRTRRFASVGDDRRLLFWDLSNASLHRPKAMPGHLRRMGGGSSLSLSRRRTIDSAVHLPIMSDNGGPVWHAPPARGDVSMLQPTMSQVLSSDLLTCVQFLKGSLVALTRSGRLLLYARPQQVQKLM